MKKITELTEIRTGTVETVNAFGQRERHYEDKEFLREVHTVRSGLRFVNYIVDMIVFQIVIGIVSTIFDTIQAYTKVDPFVNMGFVISSTLFIICLYPGFYACCEYMWQQTPGKFLTRTYVIDEYANKPELHTLLLRSVIRFIPFDGLSFLGDGYVRGWHDSWANTWVVDRSELETLKQLQIEQSEA